MRSFLFLISFGLGGLAILISLGVWQVQRLAWKEAILSNIETRIQADPVALPLRPDPEDDKYLPVAVRGQIEEAELHVLVSIKRVGPGFRVIAPMTLTDGRRVLLDRGFVPTARKEAERSTEQVDLVGNLHWPQETDGYTPAADLGANIWFARDVEAMSAHLGTEPILIVARTPTGAGATPMPVDTAGIPNDHLQYAITWFSLGLIWALMTATFLWRSSARTTG